MKIIKGKRLALGKTHDRWNIIWLTLAVGALIFFHLAWPLIGLFSLGYFFGTFIFSPDTDLGPKKRVGLLGVFLFPYQFFFQHRGKSHSLFFGTLTRVIYLIIVGALCVWVLKKMGYFNFTVESYFNLLWQALVNFDLNKIEYKMLSWFFLGHFFADFAHIVLDRVSSFFKRWIF